MATKPYLQFSCLFCCNVLEEHKPFVDDETIRKFKRSFHSFCHLLNMEAEDSIVNEILDGAIIVMEVSSQVKFRLACCGECYMALNEILRLQELIEELKTNQMGHLENLRHSLLSATEGGIYRSGKSRRMLIDCIRKYPSLSSDVGTLGCKDKNIVINDIGNSTPPAATLCHNETHLQQSIDSTSSSAPSHTSENYSVENARRRGRKRKMSENFITNDGHHQDDSQRDYTKLSPNPNIGADEDGLRKSSRHRTTHVTSMATGSRAALSSGEESVEDFEPSPDSANGDDDDDFIPLSRTRNSAVPRKRGRPPGSLSSTRQKSRTLDKITTTSKFTCDECGKKFEKSAKLDEHMRSHLPKTWRKQWNCDLCPRTFLLQNSLKQHVRRAHPTLESQSFRTCPICNIQFPAGDKYKFRVHMSTHSKDRPYVCDICGKSFTGEENLRKHLRSVHTDGRRFQCEHCECHYKNARNLRQHQLAAHENLVPREKDREKSLLHMKPEKRAGFIGPLIAFPCGICDKMFQLNCRLSQHMKACHPDSPVNIPME